MLKHKRLQAESKLLNKNVIKLSAWKEITEIIRFIPEEPSYVYCELDATDLVSIHALEEAGFRFSEFRVSSILKTDDSEISIRPFYPFVAEIITEKTQFNSAVKILQEAYDDDRFSTDPLIGKEFAKKRVIENLKKSFKSWPNEFLLGIFNSHTDELVAFRSGAIIQKTEAWLYQYGIAPASPFHHTADMVEAFTIHFLKEMGVVHIHAVSTGFNIPELNRLTQNHGYKMVSSYVLLRKVF